MATAAAKTTTTTTARKSRQPIKALNKTAETIVKNAQAEKTRKRESKKALRESLKPEQPAKSVKPVTEKTAEQRQAEQEAYIAALRVDAEATWFAGLSEVEQEEVNNGERHCPEEFVQGYINKQLDGTPKESTAKYTGPMLALRDAAKHYVTGKNGNPHNNDALAQALDGLSREEVVTTLIKAMKLESNPYLHLNPGQQSMNLRNKARGQIKNGFLTIEEIKAAVAA